MKRIFTIGLLLTGVAIISIITFSNYSRLQQNDKYPQPIKTIVVEEDEQHEKRQAWIDQMHNSAPGDNWQKMDMDYRLEKANKPNSALRDESAIYGKWKEIGSNNQAGRTLVAEYDSAENVVYLASDGGQIWKGIFEEEDWVSLTDHIRIPAIHFIRNIHLEDHNRLLIGSGVWNIPGIMYSDDGGHTWGQATGLEDILSWGNIRRTVMKKDPSEGIYILAQQWDYEEWMAISMIYVSYDLGESFQPLLSFPNGVNQVDIWTDRYQNGEVFILNKNSLYTLDETGSVDSVGEIDAEEPERVYLTGAYINEGYNLYGMQRRSGLSEFYASTDNGENWGFQSSMSSGAFMINSFKASPVTNGQLYFGGVNAFTSSNHGETWDLVNEWWEYYDNPEHKLHADIPSFDSFIDEEGNEFIFINTDGGIYQSTDDIETVSNLSLDNLNISQYYSSYTCRFAPEFSHAGSQDQGYQFSNQESDGSAIDYDQVISGDYASMVSGDGGASLWMVYPTFAMYLPDANNNGGLKFWDFVGENYQWLPQLMDDPNNPTSVYVAGGRISTGAHLIHLTYQSNQFTYIEEPFDFSDGTNATISALAYSPLDPDYRYVFTTEKDFFYSIDGGGSWTHSEGFEGPGSHYFYGAAIEPSKTTPGLVYVAGSGYSNPSVYLSNDNGVSFTEFDTGLPNTLVFDLALSPDDSLLFAATEVGAFVCKTWEGQWYDLGDSILPDQTFWAVDYVPALQGARFSTYGRGIWEFDRNPDVVAGFIADKVVADEWEPVNFTDLSEWNPTSWSWSFEGGSPATSEEQNPVITYSQTGLYDVTLIVSNGSSTDTLVKEDYIEVMVITDIENVESMTFEMFPNPANESITIKSEKTIQRIEIWDYQGRLVMNIEVEQMTDEKAIDIQSIPAGNYIVSLYIQEGKLSRKLIKK